MIYIDFIELVAKRDIRPDRPDDEDAPQLSDAIWELAKKCWVKDPKQRPTASVVCDLLSHLCDGAASSRPIPDPSPSHVIPPPHQPRVLTPSPNLIMLGHTGHVTCAAFSPDGKYIASGSRDKTIRVCDALTGDPASAPLKMHTRDVWCVAFSPNGRRIASGSRDKTILVWHAVTGKVVAGPFIRHTESVMSVVFSSDCKRIASGSHDRTICAWDAQTGNLLIGPLTGHTNSVVSVAFSGDGKQIASASWDKTVRVWDGNSGRLIQGPLIGHRNEVLFVAFSPDGKRIISAEHSGEVCVWNTTTGALVSGPSWKHMEGVLAVVFMPKSTYVAVSPNGRWIVGYRDNDFRRFSIWDSKTGQLVATMEAHNKDLYSLAFSPDGKQILSASEDKTVHVHTINW